MKFRKTDTAKYTIVYHGGKRIAHFVKDEFTTQDEKVINCLTDMGYQAIDKPKKRNVKKD